MPRPLNEGHRSRSKVGAAAGVAAGLVGGAAAGLVLGVPGVSGAADAPAVSVQQVDDESPTTESPTTESNIGVEQGDRLREVLESLVEDGTLTSDQADAVTEHLVDAAPAARWNRHRPGRHGHFVGPAVRGAVSDAVTELLGLDAETVRDELRGGMTLAELAEANGVSTETLVDTLVAEASERLDVAVENGRIDQERADEFEANLEERVTERVNGEFSRRDRFGD